MARCPSCMPIRRSLQPLFSPMTMKGLSLCNDMIQAFWRDLRAFGKSIDPGQSAQTDLCERFAICLLSASYWFYLSLTLYQTTNFRLFQTERVCRWQFQIWRKRQKVIQTDRKHCWKRRNCLLRAISPFPTLISKGLFPRGVKRSHCVGMG